MQGRGARNDLRRGCSQTCNQKAHGVGALNVVYICTAYTRYPGSAA